jgi:deoxyribose-phosphate aldolase
MKIPDELQLAVDDAQGAPVTEAVARRALAMLDLTSLNDGDTDADIRALCARAVTPFGNAAAVCVWPRFVALARAELAGTGVRIATVVNFPKGEDSTERVAADTEAARADGADEIDVVLPYRAFIDGERKRPLDLLAACRKATGDGALKVILESGAFPSADLLSWAARDALHAGADFLKTSTGKIPQGASLDAAALLLDAVRDGGLVKGVKISGGVRDSATAASYLALADAVCGPDWATPQRFRFGASGLLDRLLEVLNGENEGGTASTY